MPVVIAFIVSLVFQELHSPADSVVMLSRLFWIHSFSVVIDIAESEQFNTEKGFNFNSQRIGECSPNNDTPALGRSFYLSLSIVDVVIVLTYGKEKIRGRGGARLTLL